LYYFFCHRQDNTSNNNLLTHNIKKRNDKSISNRNRIIIMSRCYFVCSILGLALLPLLINGDNLRQHSNKKRQLDDKDEKSATTFKSVGEVQTRIVGGQTAPKGEYPYFVDIGKGCGGTLIAPSVVLSAAHCDPDGVNKIGKTVRVGAYSVFWQVDDGSQQATIEAQIVHPDYDEESVNNDYMLLLLNKSFNLDTDVELMLSQDDTDIAPGTPLTVLGLGIESQETGMQPNELLDVTIEAVSDADCADIYGEGT
jgi:hypothetical protein